MGENSGFIARNNSIATLISDAGGGSINPTGNVEGNPYTETVLPPFTGPNPIPGNQITFAAPGLRDHRHLAELLGVLHSP